MKKHIPNSLTLLNLLSGCCGIVACLENDNKFVPLFIGISLIADFLDGFVARLLKVKSDLGAQLDSLADMVTFGVLPGMMLYHLILDNTNLYSDVDYFLCFIVFIYSIFACLRLAKFNIDTRQTVDFIGLNTPSGAIFILGIYCNLYFDVLKVPILYNSVTLIIIAFVLAFLMIAEFRMFSLKGNPFSWKQNKSRVLLLLSAIPQLIFLKWLGLSTVILSYVVFAFLHNTFEKNKI